MSSDFDASIESNDDLIVVMGWKEDFPEEANAAFAEFYRRHVPFIYDRCRRAYRSDIGDDGVEDLVQDTFLRANEKAQSYDPKPDQEPEIARRSLRAWLFRFAYHLFLDIRRKEKTRFRLVTGEEGRVNACEALEETLRSLSQEEKLVQECMAEMTDRERDILTLFVSYYDLDQDGQQKPPTGVLDALCSRWNLLPENVRQIRRRALKKIEEFIVQAQATDAERKSVHVAEKGQ